MDYVVIRKRRFSTRVHWFEPMTVKKKTFPWLPSHKNVVLFYFSLYVNQPFFLTDFNVLHYSKKKTVAFDSVLFVLTVIFFFLGSRLIFCLSWRWWRRWASLVVIGPPNQIWHWFIAWISFVVLAVVLVGRSVVTTMLAIVVTRRALTTIPDMCIAEWRQGRTVACRWYSVAEF